MDFLKNTIQWYTAYKTHTDKKQGMRKDIPCKCYLKEGKDGYNCIRKNRLSVKMCHMLLRKWLWDDKMSVHQEDITIVNIYVTTPRPPK
jgi:hypothetical protein